MSAPQSPPPNSNPTVDHAIGLSPTPNTFEDQTERRVDEIEMLGEEDALGYQKIGASSVSVNARFLHSSRTIHQLITDRNRAVGLFLAVASLLWTASGAILNAKPANHLMVPIESIQRWCLPVTAGTLSVLALFTGFLLIRTRIGLIYEVAKMNVLLGLPIGRVQRVNPLSIFFIMHLMVSLGGGGCLTLFSYHMFRLFDPNGIWQMALSGLIGAALAAVLVALYVGMVLQTTAERKLNEKARS
jgi:hypothetical protein